MTRTWCTVVGMAMLASLAGDATAQGAAPSLDDLTRAGGLRPGDGVYVTGDEGGRIKGNLIDLSSAGVSLTDGRMTWTLAATAVRRIERADSLKNGMWIGAGLAFAGAVANCHLVEARRSGYCYGTVYLLPVYVSLGVGLGALIDAKLREELYKTPGPAEVRLSPMLTPGGAGALMSVGW